jgi:hypothetical protein
MVTKSWYVLFEINDVNKELSIRHKIQHIPIPHFLQIHISQFHIFKNKNSFGTSMERSIKIV